MSDQAAEAPTEPQAPQTTDEASTAPAESSEDAIEAANSIKVSLADLCAKGTSFFAHKNYAEAADYYARASELQAELNGEMDPENAEILFLYGRSLFKVGQGKSDVLGGKAGGEKKKPGASGTNGAAGKKVKQESELEKITEEGVAIVEAEKNGGGDAEAKKEEEVDGPKKPLFQFTGDENFEESDEEEAAEGEGEEEEEEDDLAVAFEVLDLARVLFTRKLEQPQEGDDKGKSVGDSGITRHVKERLSDTHDLLAEISLENERFPNAVNDFKSALALKKELHPQESEIIAEAHYKLSLALEFASITTTNDEENGDNSDAKATAQVDETMREEAAKELEAAITSTKMKLQNKEIELATSHSPEDNDVTRSQIAEVKEIVADMEQRLIDLRAPPIDVNEALNGPAAAGVGGILASAIGESPAQKDKRIEEAKKTATDLSGLVRHKKKPAATEAETAAAANGSKRKAEGEEVDLSSKKAKVEDGETEA